MLRTVDEIRDQVTPSLQKLLVDVLLDSDDPRPLMFGDEQEYIANVGKPFSIETNACFCPYVNRFVIFLKQLDRIGSKEEYDIAHELGHLWLLLLGLPPEKKASDTARQSSYDTFYSPLRDCMEHAVYFPLIKNKYQIDLYKRGNERLLEFIGSQLPDLKNGSAEEKIFLILNYIRCEVESDDQYWLDKLHVAYSEKALDVKNVADSLVPVVRELACTKDAQFFISQYRKILTIFETNFGVLPEEHWPYFCNSTNRR